MGVALLVSILCAVVAAVAAHRWQRSGATPERAAYPAAIIAILAVAALLLADAPDAGRGVAVLGASETAPPRLRRGGAGEPAATRVVAAADAKRAAAGRSAAARGPKLRESVSPVKRRAEAVEAQADADTLIVHFADSVPPSQRREAVRAAGAASAGRLDATGAEVVEASDRARVSARLRDDPRVELVEPNYVRRALDDPNDELYAFESQLFASRLPAAWDVTHGSSTIDIAILDTGVDLDHPDLISKIRPGYNAIDPGSAPTDVNGHGTMVAGVAAAQANNQIGVAGSSFSARIVPVKVLDDDGAGFDGDIAEGIAWAATPTGEGGGGAEIINLSLGAPGASQSLLDAVAYATSRGAVVVSATGNDGTEVPFFPAALPQVVAVGATDAFGDVVFFSNRGPWVDVVALGVGVATTCTVACDPTFPGYSAASGTSFASPLVAGVAALVKARNPSFTPAQLADKLRNTAIDRGPPGIDDHYGWGLLDAYAAVGGRTAAPGPSTPRDAAEPDDVAADAHDIGAGATANISPEGDIDWFSFTAPEAGTVTVTVTPQTSDLGFGALPFDPVVEAFDPALASLGSFDAEADDGLPQVAAVPVGPGVHKFKVANANSARSGGTPAIADPYSVAALFAPGATTPTPASKLWVLDASPVPFTTGVGAGVSPTVTFGRSVTPSSVNTSHVTLLDAKVGGSVAASVIYNEPTLTATIDPAANLVAGRSYFVRVTGVTDGTETMTGRFLSRFTVAAGAKALDLSADFDKDGFEDSVIAAPAEDAGSSKVDSGAVHVLYGSASGPTGSGSQIWSQDTSGILGASERNDRFGGAVATGDLNKDGYDDLVIGAPGEAIGSKSKAGAIHVLRGSANGLTANGDQMWHQDSKGIGGAAETGDRFGGALAIGDFDNVKGDDVAVGAPGEAIGAQTSAGAVSIIRGTSTGLTASGDVVWHQDVAALAFFAEKGDGFGSALAAGDFQGDTHDDLAIGTPSDNFTSSEGSVTLMRGSIVGLRPSGLLADVFEEDELEPGDAFGTSVAIADVGGHGAVDGYADLIIGVPGETTTSSRAGKAYVISSDQSDPWFNPQTIDQASFALSTRENDGLFATSLSARTFGPRGALAVGNPFVDIAGQANGGTVHMYASDPAPSLGFHPVLAAELLHQDAADMPDSAEAGDLFGADVSLLDSDGDDQPDLIVGVPAESVGAQTKAGEAISIIDVLGTLSAKVFTQNSAGVPGGAESGDAFGSPVG